MKKLIYIAFSFVMLLSTVNVAQAAEGKKSKELTTEQKGQVEQITRRVEEIQNMDKSNLSREQKKELKNELTTMKKQARAISNGGIYLSVTALLVIIIILLIL
ncbi:MAG: hypothetical protein ABIM99_03655 [Candidatus Dojkabacteria bacterium]